MISFKLKYLGQNTPRTVTVDWIVLTANAVGIAIVVIAATYAGDSQLAVSAGDYVISNNLN